jgi:hypothetical protein
MRKYFIPISHCWIDLAGQALFPLTVVFTWSIFFLGLYTVFFTYFNNFDTEHIFQFYIDMDLNSFISQKQVLLHKKNNFRLSNVYMGVFLVHSNRTLYGTRVFVMHNV